MANTLQTGKSERGWFQVYKPTQGYWTRLGTAIGVGLLILWGAAWLFARLEVYRSTSYGQYIQVGASIAWILVWGYLLYWLVGKKPETVDFLIAVEGEMKKVNWSTWPEIVGATKVVILFTILTSAMLFVVDTVFMLFFSTIGVLKVTGMGDIIKSLFG